MCWGRAREEGIAEAVAFDYRDVREPYQQLSYSGIPRHSDRHQMELCVLEAVRLCRLPTGRTIAPRRLSMVHVRTRSKAEYAHFFGTEVVFGANRDEIVFPEGSADLPLGEADPRLNRILVKVAKGTLNARRSNVSALRVSVENAITPLLPYDSARAEVVAKKLGM